MSETTEAILVMLVYMIIAVIVIVAPAYCIGRINGAGAVRTEAVNAGVAEWVVNQETLEVELRWKGAQ